MNLYRSLVFPVLRQIDAETTHNRTLEALALAQSNPAGRLFLRFLAGEIPTEPVVIAGLTFPNVLGIAAGFDKDARIVPGLAEFGFGHIEVGTLTPKPQKGNPRPRIFRLPQDQALINRMGFPNGGVREAAPRLKRLTTTPHDYIVGVSLGKQKETHLADAAGDYVEVMRVIYESADYLAVNISSPNTPGLRELQGSSYLGRLLKTIQAENSRLARQKGVAIRPLFLKIAPDLTEAELDDILAAAEAHEVQAIIATNTTISREGLSGRYQGQAGGLSGRPLAGRSTDLIRLIRQKCGPTMPIIGVGGIFNAADVREKLTAGASLVQIYTGLVYEGPAMAGRILRELAQDNNWLKIV